MNDIDAAGESVEQLDSALTKLGSELTGILAEVADEFDLTENQALALALISMQTRLREIKDGRIFLSVPADQVEFYRTSLEVLLLNADPAYIEVYETLRQGSAG